MDERRSCPLSPLRRSSTPPTQPRTEWAAGAEPPRGPDAGTSPPWSHCPVRATWLRNACGTNMPSMTRADRRGVRRSAGSVLTSLGLTLEEERQYQQLLPLSGGPAADVATVLGTTEEELGERLAPLLERGLVSLEGSRLVVLTLPALVARLIEEQAETAARARERLHDLSAAIPYLVASATRPGPGQMRGARRPRRRAERRRQRPAAAHRPDREQPGRPALVATRRLAAAPRGRDLGGGRPGGGVGTAVPGDLPAARPARGARGASGAGPPGRAGAGHRRDADPDAGHPGDARDPPGAARATPTSPGCWCGSRPSSAPSPCCSSATGTRPSRCPTSTRRLPRVDVRGSLLRQLAAGAKDEQIARTLGLSLRTVRRRVADLMIELGADTRFQAGVEAARRGWL